MAGTRTVSVERINDDLWRWLRAYCGWQEIGMGEGVNQALELLRREATRRGLDPVASMVSASPNDNPSVK